MMIGVVMTYKRWYVVWLSSIYLVFACCAMEEQKGRLFLHEIKSFQDDPVQDVVASCDQDTIVFFDLDDTLIKESIGYIPHRVAEWYIPSFIECIKNSGARVVGLTVRMARDGRAHICTEALRQLGIEFTRCEGDYTFPEVYSLEGNGPRHPQLYRGCLFTDLSDKGDVMIDYLKHFDLAPKHIVSFDDLWDRLGSEVVSWLAHRLPCHMTLFRYNGVKDKKSDWEMEIKDKLFALQNRLSIK